MSILDRFKSGLKKTREGLGNRLGFLFRSRSDEDAFFSELEEILVSSDVGVETAGQLVAGFRKEAAEQNLFGSDRLYPAFRSYLCAWMETGTVSLAPGRFTTLLLLGVNGSGKTTSAGKLAALFAAGGRKVILAAADTFRAAAVEQLAVWAERTGTPLVRQQTGADPGAVVFDALTAAKSRGCDTVIADTAGRFHNRENLVRELQKISKIIDAKTEPGDQVLRIAVLDATAGSNAFAQARSFNEAVGLDGVILTKMDSSARGGVAIAVAGTLRLPLWMVGLGEGIDDLVPFAAEAYVDALLGS